MRQKITGGVGVTPPVSIMFLLQYYEKSDADKQHQYNA